jgi:predicted naringenin-chalcone synthase
MEMYEAAAPELAQKAVDKLLADDDRSLITHLIVTSCTGFSAPGIDLELVQRCGLPNSVERTIVGFMGCYAAINALKLSRHIVRSDPKARVLIVNIELCTLHFREATELEKLISFCLWGDGCAAALVTAEPHGILLESFHAIVAVERKELMSWHIRDDGFDMVLSGQVPGAVRETLRNDHAAILGGRPAKEIDLWAVHPGGRSVLDAVERALKLEPTALAVSREVLRQYGNMSSATVMFVMAEMLKEPSGLLGCGMAFGPGLTTETMMFRTA